MDIVPPLGYLLNDAPGSPMSSPRGPMGGGAFIVAMRSTVYVTYGPYLPIANNRSEGLSVKKEDATFEKEARVQQAADREPTGAG